jgi:hypothetical protein
VRSTLSSSANSPLFGAKPLAPATAAAVRMGRPQPADQLQPVLVAEQQVDHGDLGRDPLDQLQSGVRGPGGTGVLQVVEAAQGEPEQVGERGVVIHHDDPAAR